ncbi:MCP four helix bundle domain-containing protein [uncultured Polaribacter sp.]|uniref:MCP four helix bundle domain-containing protein n=1 Tax=uncultured Polaribacter sp. TaxID=174711 RepID=UPI00262E49EC|nr:MCP four helix bundle domain-containing protein [uncultured Polaribacter sp.]
MTVFSKIKWILGIAMIFLLIIATNLIDKNNFSRVRDSVSTIYKDRIVANDLIFEISNAIHKKEIAIVLKDSIFFKRINIEVNKHISEKIEKYGTTKLTTNEAKTFAELNQNLDLLKNEESKYINSNYIDNNSLTTRISAITENLFTLSKIQLEEGERQMAISEKAFAKVDLFTQIEIYVLIFLAIVIQLIVMYDKKE